MRTVPMHAILALVAACALTVPAYADEVDKHVESLREQFEDSTLPVSQRERIALEAAATFDRAAQGSPNAEASRTRWDQAVALLDKFAKANPDQARRREFGFQAGVYRWAQARSLAQQAELLATPGDLTQRSAETLDDAITRFQKVEGSQFEAGEVLDQNIRFRLAQALIDRGQIMDQEPDRRERSEKLALTLLDLPVTEPMLRAYVLLSKSELLTKQAIRTGPKTIRSLSDDDRKALLDRSAQVIDLASRNVPPPPALALLEARVALFDARREYAEALKAIEAAKGDDLARAAMALAVLLNQRATQDPTDPATAAIDAGILDRMQSLEKRNEPEIVRARLAVGRSIRSLDHQAEPRHFGVLADSRLVAGDASGASALANQGADRAQVLGKKAESIALRMKAGAILFQAGLFAEADRPLKLVADDTEAGPSRQKASLLRAIALGRGLAAGQAGCTLAAYQAALEDHVKAFPEDPTTSEAAWLLARIVRGRGESKRALGLLTSISRTHPRWLDARRMMAEIDLKGLETSRQAVGSGQLRGDLDAARSRIRESLEMARTDAERVSIELDRVHLELIPELGSSEEARTICNRLLKTAATTELHAAVRRLKVVALSRLNRMIEAEQETREIVPQTSATELLKLARLLDQSAVISDSEVVRRRYGMLMTLMTERVIQQLETLPEELKVEANLRNARALLMSGNIQVARRALGSVATATTLDDEQLRDLADAYDRLDAQELVVEVQRLRGRRQATGSPIWFDARYGQALAYYRAGQPEQARQLIDGTAILHPELGGGEIRAKFDRLRQRLGKD